MIKKLVLGFWILTITLVSFYIALSIGEKKLFDALFYKKSNVHGYGQSFDASGYPLKNLLMRQRNRDIISLYENQTESPNVLGKQDNDTFEVAVIGDSMAYGLGLRERFNYPTALENELSKKLRVEVYNFSQPGDTILDSYFKYQAIKKSSLDIELYIFDIFTNDLMIDEMGKYATEAAYQDFKKNCSNPELKIDQQLHFSTSFEELLEKFYFPASTGQYANICYYETFLKSLDKSDFIVFNSWMFYDENLVNNKSSSIADQMIKLARMNGFNVLVPLHTNGIEYQQISDKETHPNANMHRELAKFISRFIEERVNK